MSKIKKYKVYAVYQAQVYLGEYKAKNTSDAIQDAWHWGNIKNIVPDTISLCPECSTKFERKVLDYNRIWAMPADFNKRGANEPKQTE